MKILAIETSCDDTGIAIIEATEDKKITSLDEKTIFKILANDVSSQIDIHKEYGGVFPALAKREHTKNLPLVLEKVLREAKIKEKDLQEKIDAIAVTTGPGLEPALWTGIVFAKKLSKKYKLPIIPVNHMEGHIFSIFPKKGKSFKVVNKKELFPMLSLLVSGGHTELVLIKNFMKYKKIGQTRDDAAGEAFDKVSRMLGLSYPGGPEISKLAKKERELGHNVKRKYIVPGNLTEADKPSTIKKNSKVLLCTNGNNISNEKSRLITLPRPMMYSKDYDFSFSGLKTSVLYLIRDLEKEYNIKLSTQSKLVLSWKKKIACEFENAVVETLIHKTIKAIKEYKINTLIVGGGVSANTYLQEQIKQKLKEEKIKVKVYFPSRSLCGDNALMIAITGYFQYKNKKPIKNSQLIKANGNLSL